MIAEAVTVQSMIEMQRLRRFQFNRTDGTVKTLENALQAVIRGLKQNEQDKVNQMAANIEAVKGLKKKPTSDNNTNNGTNNDTNTAGSNTGNTTLDKNNLKDGIYEVPVWIWHATKNQASMAAQSLKTIQMRIVVKKWCENNVHLHKIHEIWKH